MLNRIFSIGSVLLLGVAVCMLVSCSGTDEKEIFKEDVKQALNHYYRAIELRVKKDFDTATEEVEKSIEISPRPRAYLLLAEIALAQNQLDQAELHVDQALQLSPNLTLAKQLKQQITRVQRERGTIAAAATPTAVPVDRGEPLPERETSVVEQAETITQPVIQPEAIQPPTPTPTPVQTETIAEPILQPEAVEPTALAQSDVASDLVPARDAVNQRNWPAAARLLQEYMAKHPNSAEGYYLLGYAHFQQKNYAEAEQAMREAVRFNPNHAEALNDLGITMEYLGRSAEAVEYYERAVQIGTNPDAFFNLALLEEKRGQYRKAIALYERYLTQDEESSFADFARERIHKLRRAEY